MKILVLADIHNDTENLMKFLDKVEEITNFDLIVAIGDFTDVNIPKGFTTIDIGNIIIEILKTRKKPILAIPGNFDKELIKLFEDEDISL
ncbi:MAG: metallophosphoesterase, partial [Candidatus Aenigmarchaeota archaeon]|nr:metallophosphoesterase [Candidatus Aenigmarchaeota archaeon]